MPKIKYIIGIATVTFIGLMFFIYAFPITTDFYLVISSNHNKFILTYEFDGAYTIKCGEGGGMVFQNAEQARDGIIDSKQMFHSDPVYEFHEKEVAVNLFQRMTLNRLLNKLTNMKKRNNVYNQDSDYYATLFIDNKNFSAGSVDGGGFVTSFGFYTATNSLHYEGNKEVIALMRKLLLYTKDVFGDIERWSGFFKIQ